MDLKKQFEEQGYILVPNLIDKDLSKQYIASLKELDGKMKKDSWTIPDGVIQHEAFWSIIFNEAVLAKIEAILGSGFKFLQHNDLHHGYSSFAWHRDSINRTYNQELPDWQESVEPYKMVRCGFYFQPKENNFELGVLPGSHKLTGHLTEEEFLEVDKYLTNFENAKVKLGIKDILKEKAVWINTAPGDCVIFDPRLIHTGSEFKAQKYSVFSAYGQPNKHMERHYTYYRHLRYDLNYKPFPEALASKLKDSNLYMDEKQYVDKIEGAFIPSKLFSYISKHFT